MPAESSDGGDFLKWADGETKTVEILSDQPIYHELHWVNGQAQPHTPRDCQHCRAGTKVSQRYLVKATSNGQEVEWEMSGMTFEDVAVAAQRVGYLNGLRLEVTRKGKERQTRYKVFLLSPVTGNNQTLQGSISQVPNVHVTIPPVPEMAVDPEWDHVAVQNPLEVKSYIQGLCKTLDVDPKESISEMVRIYGPEFTRAPASRQLAAIATYLDKQAAQAREQESEADLLGLLDIPAF
jgi:hypothetical protein